MMRWTLAVAVAGAGVLSSGCLTPRSAGYGVGAGALKMGGAEAGVAMGVVYQTVSTAPQDVAGARLVTTTRGLQAPSFEANAQIGISDEVGLNLHFSPAGLQPGVKISFMKGPVELAVLPAISFGYSTNSTGTATTINNTTTTSEGAITSNLGVLAGLKILASVPGGLYAGVGYDFQYTSQEQRQNPTATPNVTTGMGHNVTAAAGFELKMGALLLRPEAAVVYTPLTGSQTVQGTSTTTNPDTSAWHFFPNLTVAVSSEGRRSR